MKPLIKRYALIAFAITLGWFVIWYIALSADVTRIEKTLEYHGVRLKQTNRFVTLKAESVSRAGFPFAFRVKVTRPTLSMIWGKETFAVSLPELSLSMADSSEARYRVTLPQEIDALYALDGKTPESYVVTVETPPKLLLRAQGSSTRCPNMPGLTHCQAPEDDAPLVAFAAAFPDLLKLDVRLGENTKPIEFKIASIGVPVFYDIPTDGARPLELFVGMLREAMVFQAK